ncbi:MAG: NAD(P)H-dependent oxidoreductase [Pyrinomonadaceae bacterium]
MTTKKIALIVGSLRQGSFSRKIANELIRIAPTGLELGIVEIGDLPHYNEDLESADPPKPWTDFRQSLGSSDGVIFITPEYNRTIPGALKNAIDVGSRPYGHSIWQGKPGAVVSSSPGATGGFGANHNVRQAVVFLGVPMMQNEAYIGQVHTLFDDAGQFVESTAAFLGKFLADFEVWVNRF